MAKGETGKQLRAGALVVEAYRAIREFDDPLEYLDVLTDHLDSLCIAYGEVPPIIEGVFDDLRGEAGDRR